VTDAQVRSTIFEEFIDFELQSAPRCSVPLRCKICGSRLTTLRHSNRELSPPPGPAAWVKLAARVIGVPFFLVFPGVPERRPPRSDARLGGRIGSAPFQSWDETSVLAINEDAGFAILNRNQLCNNGKSQASNDSSFEPATIMVSFRSGPFETEPISTSVRSSRNRRYVFAFGGSESSEVVPRVEAFHPGRYS
jgi:hypothetical protein